MKRLLIVRSVSFSQLDINMPQIEKQFQGYQIDVLTNSSSVDTVKKYKCINKVYIYNFDGSFNKKNVVKEIKDQKFDVVIILVNNVSGLFFENVIHFGYSIKAEKYYICNMASELKKITRLNLISNDLLNISIKLIASVLTLPIVVIYYIKVCLKNG